jgi:hypothetical protein
LCHIFIYLNQTIIIIIYSCLVAPRLSARLTRQDWNRLDFFGVNEKVKLLHRPQSKTVAPIAAALRIDSATAEVQAPGVAG